MARCKQCNKEIPDGQDYCNNCLEDNMVKTDESYLDDLLQTLMSTQNEDSAVKSEKVVKKANDVAMDIGKGEPVKDSEEVITTNEDVIPQFSGTEDNETEEEFTDNTDDLLALMQDFQESNELVETSEEHSNQTIYHDDFDDNQSDDLENKSDLTVYNPIDQDDNSQILDTDEDLLNLLDMISNQTDTGLAGADTLNIPTVSNQADTTDNSQAFKDDILAIDELLENSSAITNEITGSSTNNEVPSDVGKVFSDVVSAVDSLADDEKQRPTDNTSGGQNQYFDAANKPADKKQESSIDTKKKKSLFQKLFGKDESDVEDTAKQNTDKIIKKSKVKTKDSKKSKISGKADSESDDKTDKSAKSSANNKKKADTKKKIKPKKVNSTLKAVKEIDDFDDSKKLNRTAVTLIFTFLSVLAAFIIIGTNMYSYSLGIKNATKEFERKRYTQAYNEIYGVDLKKKDYEIYDKIMTVMFVNKQLNSYNSYYTIGMYPEALDSLLKGLDRYDKYIAKAKKLGIKSDLDYVRNQIINELESKFKLTEKMAKTLNKNNDQVKYSMIVINAASEK